MSNNITQSPNYSYSIDISDGGLIFGQVIRNSNGERVGIKLSRSFIFSSSPKFIEYRAKKMHGWAKNYIAMCERQEKSLA